MAKKEMIKSFVLRVDAETMEAIEKWAADEFRSTNGQLQWIIAEALRKSGRMKKKKLAGDSEGSWKTRLEQAGLSVTPILEGLGESPIFRQIYIAKARKALGES